MVKFCQIKKKLFIFYKNLINNRVLTHIIRKNMKSKKIKDLKPQVKLLNSNLKELNGKPNLRPPFTTGCISQRYIKIIRT